MKERNDIEVFIKCFKENFNLLIDDNKEYIYDIIRAPEIPDKALDVGFQQKMDSLTEIFNVGKDIIKKADDIRCLIDERSTELNKKSNERIVKMESISKKDIESNLRSQVLSKLVEANKDNMEYIELCQDYCSFLLFITTNRKRKRGASPPRPPPPRSSSVNKKNDSDQNEPPDSHKNTKTYQKEREFYCIWSSPIDVLSTGKRTLLEITSLEMEMFFFYFIIEAFSIKYWILNDIIINLQFSSKDITYEKLKENTIKATNSFAASKGIIGRIEKKWVSFSALQKFKLNPVTLQPKRKPQHTSHTASPNKKEVHSPKDELSKRVRIGDSDKDHNPYSSDDDDDDDDGDDDDDDDDNSDEKDGVSSEDNESSEDDEDGEDGDHKKPNELLSIDAFSSFIKYTAPFFYSISTIFYYISTLGLLFHSDLEKPEDVEDTDDLDHRRYHEEFSDLSQSILKIVLIIKEEMQTLSDVYNKVDCDYLEGDLIGIWDVHSCLLAFYDSLSKTMIVFSSLFGDHEKDKRTATHRLGAFLLISSITNFPLRNNNRNLPNDVKKLKGCLFYTKFWEELLEKTEFYRTLSRLKMDTKKNIAEKLMDILFEDNPTSKDYDPCIFWEWFRNTVDEKTDVSTFSKSNAQEAFAKWAEEKSKTFSPEIYGNQKQGWFFSKSKISPFNLESDAFISWLFGNYQSIISGQEPKKKIINLNKFVSVEHCKDLPNLKYKSFSYNNLQLFSLSLFLKILFDNRYEEGFANCVKSEKIFDNFLHSFFYYSFIRRFSFSNENGFFLFNRKKDFPKGEDYKYIRQSLSTHQPISHLYENKKILPFYFMSDQIMKKEDPPLFYITQPLITFTTNNCHSINWNSLTCNPRVSQLLNDFHSHSLDLFDPNDFNDENLYFLNRVFKEKKNKIKKSAQDLLDLINNKRISFPGVETQFFELYVIFQSGTVYSSEYTRIDTPRYKKSTRAFFENYKLK